nr:MAG TPA: hypothetical protein [Caudoviricetes sp.]
MRINAVSLNGGKSMDENSHVPCCFIYQQSAIGTSILRAGSVMPYLVQVRRQD